jgi:ADP-ribose pyrophosphatase YjhB (NUDIX family)
MIPNSYCHACGTLYKNDAWPRTCDNCNMQMWKRTNPVAVVLQPVFDGRHKGILLGRRTIDPQAGTWGLPGGFVEFGETIEAAALRELYEEMGIKSKLLRFSHSFADNKGILLTFLEAVPKSIIDIEQDFKPSPECDAYLIAYTPRELSFDSHTEALDIWLSNHTY